MEKLNKTNVNYEDSLTTICESLVILLNKIKKMEDCLESKEKNHQTDIGVGQKLESIAQNLETIAKTVQQLEQIAESRIDMFTNLFERMNLNVDDIKHSLLYKP